MIKNVGKTDRNIRMVLGVIVTALGILKMSTWITLVGVILLATGAVGTCLAYVPFNFKTTK